MLFHNYIVANCPLYTKVFIINRHGSGAVSGNGEDAREKKKKFYDLKEDFTDQLATKLVQMVTDTES